MPWELANHMQRLRVFDIIMNDSFKRRREVACPMCITTSYWYLHGRIHVNNRHIDIMLVAGLPPRRRGFLPRPLHVEFMVDKVAIEEVFLRVLWFSPVSISPFMLHTHLYICLLPTFYKLSSWQLC